MRACSQILLFLLFLTIFAPSALSQQTAGELYEKGMEVMKSGRYKEAIPFFDEALRLDSGNIGALLARSRAKSNNQDDLKGALDDLTVVLQLDPQNGEAFFERAVLSNTMISFMIRENGGMSTDELRPYREAVLNDINSAIGNGFANKRSFSYRADYYSRHFRNETAAIEDYTKALQYDPYDVHLLMSRAHAKRGKDDLAGAETDLLEVYSRYEALKSDPGADPNRVAELKGAAVMALNNLSSVYALTEDPEKQMWAIDRSIELDPTAMAYISRARQKMIYGNLDESIADYTMAIEMSEGKIARYYMDRGIVYLLQERETEAQADFETGRKLDERLELFNLKYWLELARRQRAQRTVKVELPN